MSAIPNTSAKHSLDTLAANVATREGYEAAIAYASFILLLLSCTGESVAGNIGKLLWLSSVFMLTWLNIGAAVAIYISSLAIFSVAGSGHGSVFDRPDSVALVIIILKSVLFGATSGVTRGKRRLVLILVSFCLVTLWQIQLFGNLSRHNVGLFARMFGLPLLFYVVLCRQAVGSSEVQGFLRITRLLGLYMAVVSILEAFDLYSVIIPSWIADARVNGTIGTGRAGGLLMQPEWNGLVLGLLACLELGRTFMIKSSSKPLAFMAMAVCLMGVSVTYTRGAWLGVVLAAPLLLRATVVYKRDKPGSVLLAMMVGLGLVLCLTAVLSSTMTQSRVGNEETVRYRFNVWASALEMVKSRPLLGFGFGRFRENVDDYPSPLHSGPSIKWKGAVAHNTPISIIAEQGLIGFVLYLLTFVFIVRISKRSAGTVWPRGGPVWVLAFVLVYVVNIQFIVAHEPTSNLLFFGTMGIISGLRPVPES